jgi:WD40 repeat protein
VNGVDFSPDGNSLATVSRDNTARVQHWNLTPQELTDKVCERLTGNLTEDEWRQYVGSWFQNKTCSNLPNSGRRG